MDHELAETALPAIVAGEPARLADPAILDLVMSLVYAIIQRPTDKLQFENHSN